MKPRIVFVHGNGSFSWQTAWTPWLKSKLETEGFPTHFETMPDPHDARAEFWLPYLQDRAKVGDNDVIVGWSSGAVAAMRYAEQHRLYGSVLISPSYTDLGDELERQSGYFNNPWQWQAIHDNQQHIALFCGSDDPYIPQADFTFISEQLDCPKTVILGGRHFIERTEFPELLDYILATYS